MCVIRRVDYHPDELPSLVASALIPYVPDGATQLQFPCIEGKHILILLDNCEHLLGPVSEFSERLLEATSTIRLLATSREALRVRNEAIFPVSLSSCLLPKTLTTWNAIPLWPCFLTVSETHLSHPIAEP